MAMPTVSIGLNSMQSHPLPFGIANSGFGAEPPVGLVSTSVAMGAQPIMQAYGDFPRCRGQLLCSKQVLVPNLVCMYLKT